MRFDAKAPGSICMSKLYESSCYCTNIRRCSNLLTDIYDEALKESGLTIAQYYLLINLSRLGKANITHWAERIGLDRSTMVRNVKLLQKREYIEETEGNGKTFKLSAVGENVLEKAQRSWDNAQTELEGFLGPEDAQELLRLTRKLQELT